MRIRLMIADDHMVVRTGVAALVLGTEIEVVCQAETFEETVRNAPVCAPDVLLLDVRLGENSGLDALATFRNDHSTLAVVMYSVSDDLWAMATAYSLGARGYVTKGATRDEFLAVIRRAAAGKMAWTSRQVRQITSRAALISITRKQKGPLTERESQILGKIQEGLSNDAIAKALGINVETVKQHVKRCLKKLCLVDRTQAALWAMRNLDAGPQKANSSDSHQVPENARQSSESEPEDCQDGSKGFQGDNI